VAVVHAEVMTLAAAILFAVAAAAELGGVALIVAGIRAAKRKLDTPVRHSIDGGNAFSTFVYPPREARNAPEVFVLEAMEKQRLAVALLVLGIVAGTVGNFLTLDWS
jgi:hypothetical protein